MTASRAGLVRRGLLLNYTTLGYNCLEGLIAIGAGLVAGSIALVGFGLDSLIEVSASLLALWRLYGDVRRERAEHVALRAVGALFLLLAAYVTADAAHARAAGTAPDESLIGIVLAALSLLVMPLLARAKRRVAFAMSSGALAAEARQTAFCTYLSGILLVGLLLNAMVGWWWADPVGTASAAAQPASTAAPSGTRPDERGYTTPCASHDDVGDDGRVPTGDLEPFLTFSPT